MSFEYFVKTVGPTLQIVFFSNFGFCVGASVSLLLFCTTNIVPTDNEICNLVSNEKKNAIAKRSNSQISEGCF